MSPWERHDAQHERVGVPHENAHHEIGTHAAGIFFFRLCCPDSSAMGVFQVADKIDEGIYPKEMV